MSNLNSIINVSISRTTTTPTQTGFGTPLLISADPQINPASGSEWGTERVRTYNSLSAVGDDFATTTNVYRMATALFAQTPAPPSVKIGRWSTALISQVTTITPSSFAENASWGFSVNGTVYSFTNGGAYVDIEDAIDAFLASAVKTTIEAAHDVTLTKSGITASAVMLATSDTVGETFRYGNPTNVTLRETTNVTSTESAGLITDFNAMIDADNDFYCVLLDACHEDLIVALAGDIAGKASSNPKLFIAQTFDTAVKTVTAANDVTATSPTVAGYLKENAYDRVALVYSESGDYVDCAWAGRCLPELAGSITWGWKSLIGVTVDSALTDTHETNLEAKYVNFFTTVAGVNAIRYGITSGNEWIDIMRGSDWTAARIRERVLTLILNRDKVPYTEQGIELVRAEILSQLQNGVSRGFLAATPEPTCTVPDITIITAANKSGRHLTGVKFRAILAGAIHKTTLVGELSL